MMDRFGGKRFENSVAAVMRRLKRVAEARYRRAVQSEAENPQRRSPLT